VQRIDEHKRNILQDKFHEVLLFLKTVFKSLYKSMKLCKILFFLLLEINDLNFYFDH